MNRYESIADELLVEMYQNDQNEEAFHTLFCRYKSMLKRKSLFDAKHMGIDYNSIHSKYIQRFSESVKRYNAQKGASFRTFLEKRVSKAGHDVMVQEKFRKLTDKEGNRLRKAQPVEPQILTQTLQEQMDFADSLVVNDIILHVEQVSPVFSTVLTMRMQGYNYEEIAELMGRTGSPAALRNWTRRIIEKIGEIVKEYYKEVE